MDHDDSVRRFRKKLLPTIYVASERTNDRQNTHKKQKKKNILFYSEISPDFFASIIALIQC